jgi:hypothetical protein
VLLSAFSRLVKLIGDDVYGAFETEARERPGTRDPEDWPIMAVLSQFTPFRRKPVEEDASASLVICPE